MISSTASLISKFSLPSIFRSTLNNNGLKSVILGYSISPSRGRFSIWKPKVHDNKWVPRKRAYTDDKITFENRQFLQEVIADKFLKPGESPLKEQETVERPKWTPESIRTGLIAKKIGIYPMWTKTGKRLLTTLLQVVDNHVIRYNPPELFSQSKYYDKCKDTSKTYGSLVVGAESADPQLFTAAYSGLFNEAGVMPKKKLTRFRITPDAIVEPGTALFASHFRVGDYVNVYGTGKYYGFQGVVKRWGFRGGTADIRGCTKSHRRPGCVGSGRKRGIWKGKKMPGLMGGRQRLTVGLKIWRINTKYNVLYVHGPGVPGVNGNYCHIYDCYVAKKSHKQENPPPFPTFYPEDINEGLPENVYDKDLHNFSDPTVNLADEEELKKANA